MLKRKNKNFIEKINYKDIIIIFGIWYFTAALNFLAGQVNIKYTPQLSGFFHFLFIFTGRLLFLGLIIFYFTSLYSISFSDLGLSFSRLKKQFIEIIYIFIFFTVITLIFINIPLSYHELTDKFQPLFETNNPGVLIKSIIPLFLLIIPNLIIALSEQFILNNIVLEIFNFKMNIMISVLFSALFYSVILFSFNPRHILINTIIGFISIYLYLKAEGSLYLPSLFISIYYSLYILYIYGWDYIIF